MTNEDVYEIWRPENSPWRQWIKPVVFPFLNPEVHGRGEYSVQGWQVTLHSDTAIVADLPGAESVSAGIAMARAGYLPVLLYNACPNAAFDAASPGSVSIRNPQPKRYPQPISPRVVVDMSSILTALCATAGELASLSLPAEAPPVFLLDSNRRGLGIAYRPGWFDNRSFVAPTDFPSAEYFRSHGIGKLILIQPTPPNISPDLRQVVLRLQQEGMGIAMQAPWDRWEPCGLVVKPPMFLISAWERFRRKFGYRPGIFHGSFGGVVPPGSGS